MSVAAAFLPRPSELGLLQIFLVTTKVALLSTTYRNAQRNLRSPWRHFLLASLRFYPAPCRDRLDVERACECPLQPLPPPPLLSSSPPRPSHIRPLPQVFHFCHQQRQPRRRLRMEGRSSMFGWTSSLPWIYTMGGREYRDDRPFSLALSLPLSVIFTFSSSSSVFEEKSDSLCSILKLSRTWPRLSDRQLIFLVSPFWSPSLESVFRSVCLSNRDGRTNIAVFRRGK